MDSVVLLLSAHSSLLSCFEVDLEAEREDDHLGVFEPCFRVNSVPVEGLERNNGALENPLIMEISAVSNMRTRIMVKIG